MPKKDKKTNKNEFIGLRITDKEVESLDNFIEDWKTISLDQLDLSKGKFKRSGVLRFALDEYLERYNLRKAYKEGNVYSTRLNAHDFKWEDIVSIIEMCKKMTKQDNFTKGEKYLLKTMQELLENYMTDVSNSGSLNNTYYQQTKRLFIDQWQVKEEIKKAEEEGTLDE